MDMLTKELEKDHQAAEHEEKTSQKDYEELMSESAKTRAADSKSVVDLQATKANKEGMLDAAKENLVITSDALNTNVEHTAALHQDCDFIVANFEVRRAKRTNEVDGLANAKSVLSGASYEF